MEFIIKYWTQIIFIGGVIATLIKFYVTMNEALKCSLRNDMLSIYEKCKVMKQITLYELQAFTYSYERYKKMKGNSFVDEIYKEIKKFEKVP